VFKKSSNDTSCPLSMSISFNLLKIDCAFNCNLYIINNGFSICVLWSVGNGKWSLHIGFFSYNKFICDNEVDFTKTFEQIFFITSYVFINKWLHFITLSIPYFGVSFIHKSLWSCSLPLAWNSIMKKNLLLVQIIYLLMMITCKSISFDGHNIMHKLLDLLQQVQKCIHHQIDIFFMSVMNFFYSWNLISFFLVLWNFSLVHEVFLVNLSICFQHFWK